MTTRHHTRIIKNRAIKRWIAGRQKLSDPQQLTISPAESARINAGFYHLGVEDDAVDVVKIGV
jgi:hypothetical protein